MKYFTAGLETFWYCTKFVVLSSSFNCKRGSPHQMSHLLLHPLGGSSLPHDHLGARVKHHPRRVCGTPKKTPLRLICKHSSKVICKTKRPTDRFLWKSSVNKPRKWPASTCFGLKSLDVSQCLSRVTKVMKTWVWRLKDRQVPPLQTLKTVLFKNKLNKKSPKADGKVPKLSFWKLL